MSRAGFRFSLRSLLLAVLLIASAGMLYWNWGPWVPVKTVVADGLNGTCTIHGGGRFVVLDLCIATPPQYSREKRVYEIIRVPDGTSDLKLWPVTTGGDVDFSDDGLYMRFGDFLYRTDTGKKSKLEFPGNEYSFGSDSGWIRHGNDWLHLPECSQHPLSSHIIAANNDWTLVVDGGGSSVYRFQHSSKEDKPLFHWPVDAIWAQFLPNERLVTWNNAYLLFYNLHTGEFSKKISCSSKPYLSWDNDGNWIYIAQALSSGDPGIWRFKPKMDFAYVIPSKRVDDPPAFATDFLLISKPLSALDASSGRALWSNAAESGSYLSDQTFVVSCDRIANVCRVLDARTGNTVYELPRIRWPGQLTNLQYVNSLNGPTTFLTWSSDDHSVQFSIWDLRRPYQWYGPLYLPEFWLTFFFAVALGWSIISNARRAKKQTSVEHK